MMVTAILGNLHTSVTLCCLVLCLLAAPVEPGLLRLVVGRLGEQMILIQPASNRWRRPLK
jgi:hypothetical protein